MITIIVTIIMIYTCIHRYTYGRERSGLAPGWAYKTDAKHFTQPGPWMEATRHAALLLCLCFM